MTKNRGPFYLMLIVAAVAVGGELGRQSDGDAIDRGIFAESLSNETDGYQFFASGPTSRTLSVAISPPDQATCDEAIAVIDSTPEFVSDLYGKGFRDVSCIADDAKGKTVVIDEKIAPYLPREKHHDWPASPPNHNNALGFEV